MKCTRFRNTLLIAALLAMFAVAGQVRAEGVSRIDSVGFTVSDMDAALAFYTGVLPFEKLADTEKWGPDVERLTGVFGARIRVVRLKLGDETVELTEFLTPKGRPVPADSRSNDRWFQHIAIIVSDMDRAYAALRKHRVRHASTGPQTLPEYITAAAGIRAFYFMDPDGHILEILEFPVGKGSPKWRTLASTGKLFLGIDHTAIVVSNTERSLDFYRGQLGLALAGESMNYGPEQERLNNVFGARLHISGLATPEGGIAVEFLEYKAPSDGRPYPPDSRSNDLWHWQTSFVTRNAEVVIARFRTVFVSSGIVPFFDQQRGFRRSAVVRDPDGHAVRLLE